MSLLFGLSNTNTKLMKSPLVKFSADFPNIFTL